MKITDVFDFFSRNRGIRSVSLIALSVILAVLLSRLDFSEDISDFLPLGTREREQMSVYQTISGADKLLILFSNPGDADETVEAIDCFVDAALENDTKGWCEKISAQFDMDALAGVSNFVYDNIPYFLTESDIARMDSLLAEPACIPSALARDKQVLMFPNPSLVVKGISHDPLGLFSPVMERLQASSGQQGFELYDGYIFTPDMSRAVVMLDSPFGNSETSNNAKLLHYLEETSLQMQERYPDVSVDIIGGPAIAVGNSSRIKKDSVLAIALSVILMVLLLAYSFNSVKNIFLIFLTVGWGLLFALGSLALFRDNVSIIVIGISSVIIGLAINYPLHLVAHTAYQPDRRLAISEIASPLVVGNITTVGAFLALVPLKSTALRDLGLFASLLLVGTILFVLIYLPHYVATAHGKKRANGRLIERLSAFSPEKIKGMVAGTAIITLVLLYFSLQTEFDSDMSHMNYMTANQQREMQYFEDLLTKDDTHTARSLYVYGSGSTFDEALEAIAPGGARIDSLSANGVLTKQNEALAFITTRAEQQQRLQRWNRFVDRHRDRLTDELREEAVKAGFAPGAFASFNQLIANAPSLTAQDIDYFEPLVQTVFNQNFTRSDDNGTVYVVCPVNVQPDRLETAKTALGDDCFEISEINRSMTRSLSDNFNYIGWACSLIVFFFLWFSFGRIELAVISFLPMAVSWVWILGIMALLGIKFNIVNIILATFIFGQGDDYTIFMTEGCQYEYSRRRPILKAYKSSIIQSAAIMFVGIGTLIVAKHPAMHSLAEVTIIGMFSVVLMAYLIPPFLFNFLTTKKGQARPYPITLKTLLLGRPKDLAARVEGRYAYKGKEIERCVRRNLKEKSRAILAMKVEGPQSVDYRDDGYGELSFLLALSHPDITVVSHISDEERRQIALVATQGMVDNIIIQS
ncbi:MAG: MMPL family transporter [Bacteroidales bacterium]|nr:MMPL family transporter [Bacteroidales bacterium]